MLNYKKEIPEMTDLLALYSSVGWTNYTNNPTMLEEAVKASLWQMTVYDKEELVAYIRLVVLRISRPTFTIIRFSSVRPLKIMSKS